MQVTAFECPLKYKFLIYMKMKRKLAVIKML